MVYNMQIIHFHIVKLKEFFSYKIGKHKFFLMTAHLENQFGSYTRG